MAFPSMDGDCPESWPDPDAGLAEPFSDEHMLPVTNACPGEYPLHHIRLDLEFSAIIALSHFVMRICIPEGNVNASLREEIMQEVLKTRVLDHGVHDVATFAEVIACLARCGVRPVDPRRCEPDTSVSQAFLDHFIEGYRVQTVCAPTSEEELDPTTFLLDIPVGLTKVMLGNTFCLWDGGKVLHEFWGFPYTVERFVKTGQLKISRGARVIYSLGSDFRCQRKGRLVCGVAPLMSLRFSFSGGTIDARIESDWCRCAASVVHITVSISDVSLTESPVLRATFRTRCEDNNVTETSVLLTQARKLGIYVVSFQYVMDFTSADFCDLNGVQDGVLVFDQVVLASVSGRLLHGSVSTIGVAEVSKSMRHTFARTIRPIPASTTLPKHFVEVDDDDWPQFFSDVVNPVTAPSSISSKLSSWPRRVPDA